MARTFLIAAATLMAVAACTARDPLQGQWAVDTEATVKRAVADGIPQAMAPKIREVYDGGRLAIGKDVLTLRIAGFGEAEARNYEVVGNSKGCYQLQIARSQGVHAYCIEGEQLVVKDPSAKLAVVFSPE